MAEAFLHELLQTSNSVQSDTQDHCVICLQETGAMSPETGFIELMLRLPCNHLVGSGCIAMWLKENNSCPICREVFFPAQPRPYLEHDVMEDHEEQEVEDEEEEEDRRLLLERMCQDYCLQLELNRRTTEIAQVIILNTVRTYPYNQAVGGFYDDNAVNVVALGIYIASCIAGYPRSPREICGVVDILGRRIRDSRAINGDRIRENYDTVYNRRGELIEDEIIDSLEDRKVVWPSSDPYESSDDQIECGRDLLLMRVHCVYYSTRLRVPSPIDDLSQHIAANLIFAGFRTLSSPENSEYVYQSDLYAVSIYIAAHLVGQPISRRAIQDLIGDEGSHIRSTCRIVREACNQLVSDDFRKTLDVQLSWETLDAEISAAAGGSTEANQRREEEDAASRTRRIATLCDRYCYRLFDTNTAPINLFALQLSTAFTFKTFTGHSPEAVAAAGVYMACKCKGYDVSYGSLMAAAGIPISSIHTAHAMMVHQIGVRRVNVQHVVREFAVGIPAMVQTVPRDDPRSGYY